VGRSPNLHTWRPALRKIIVSVAPVAPPAHPLTPEAVAADVLASAQAGATVVHLHVRDAQGQATADPSAFARTLAAVRAGSEMIVEASTSGVAGQSLAERCVGLCDPRVEMGSLNLGSDDPQEATYARTLADLRYRTARMAEAHIRPLLLAFEGGVLANAALLAAEGRLQPPFVCDLALGFPGALPATPHVLHFLQGLLPAGALWGLIHHGMQDLALLATAISMGASLVRVGLEDSVYYAPGRAARTNPELVERTVALIRHMGLEVATPQEARAMLHLAHEAPG
jgi:3-keto-5-aminohexanoate cleavage enzyme